MDCITKQYTIKVTEGNAFGLLLKLKTRTFQSSVPIDEDIDPTQLQDIVIKVSNTTWESTDYTVDESGVLISIPADLPVGTYPVILTATYYGIQIRAAYYECFSIMPWSYQSDAGNYIPGSPIAAEAAYLIVGIIDDAELEELKQEYREKIAAAEEAEAEAEAAKEAFDEKAENLDNLDNVALQGTDATATNTALKSLLQVIQGLIGTATDEQTAATLFGKIAAVLYAVGNIDFSAIAKESTLNTVKALIGEATDAATAATLFGKLAAVLSAVGNIDFSTLAKQGSNASATLTATQTAATNAYASAEAAKTATVDGNDTAVGVAKEVRSEVGSGSDTAAETGTLFAVVKWVKDKVKSIFNLIGSPATGQPATLFAAIAAGGGGGSADALETEVETGKGLIAQAIEDRGGTATSSMSLAQLAQAIDTTQLIPKSVVSAITFSNVVDNKILDLAFMKGFTGNLSFEGVSQVEEIKNIPTLIAQTTLASMFYGCSSLKSIPSFTCPNLIYTAGTNLIRDCISLTSANLSVFGVYKFTSLNSAFYNISCESIDISAIDTSECTDFLTLFGASPNIIKINMLGLNLSSATTGLSNWFSSSAAVTTFVGDETYDNVVNNDLKTFVGLNQANPNMRINYCAQLNQASLRAILNGLADRTGQTSINFTMGAVNKAKLSADDIAVATAKNWGIV